MSFDTESIKRGASRHRKTILGGLGGGSIVGLAALAVPFFSDMTEGDSKQWQQIGELRRDVADLKTDVAILKDRSSRSP